MARPEGRGVEAIRAAREACRVLRVVVRVACLRWRARRRGLVSGLGGVVEGLVVVVLSFDCVGSFAVVVVVSCFMVVVAAS